MVGSCIANILGGLGLGLVLLPSGLVYDSSTKRYAASQLFVTLLASILALNAAWIDRRLCAAILFATFVVYVLVTLRSIWKGDMEAPEDSDDDSDDVSQSEDVGANSTGDHDSADSDNEGSALLNNADGPRRRTSVLRNVVVLLFIAAVVSLASYLITTSLVILAEKLGLTETTAGLTILSFITTIPEKFLAVIAGKRARTGVVIAGAAGSNIFLLTLCLGVVFSSKEASDVVTRPKEIFVALGCSLVMTCLVLLLPGTSRWAGLLLLLAYGAFLVTELTFPSSS